MNEQQEELDSNEVLKDIRRDICDAEIEIGAHEQNPLRSSPGRIAYLRGRIAALKRQFEAVKMFADPKGS